MTSAWPNRSWIGPIVALGLMACGHPGGSAAEPGALPAVHDADRARAVHDRALVVDAHADIELPGKPSRYVGADGLSKVAPAKMGQGGVDAVVMAVAVGPGPRTAEGHAAARAEADEKLAAVLALAEGPGDRVAIVRSSDELVAAHEAGARALVLGLQNARIFGGDVDVIDEFHALGVRVFALTHMGHNDFADSSRPLYDGETRSYEPDAEHGGLSALGRAAVTRINDLGALFDVSQLSKPATLQAVAASRAPVIASHSNVQALSNVRRNLSDEEIDAIGANGGVIHISSFKGYLFDSSDPSLDAEIRAARRAAGVEEDYDYPFELYWEIPDPKVQGTFVAEVSRILGPGRISDMIDHIDYVVERIGIDHVGIGTDFNHGSGIAGFDDASEAGNVTVALLDRGYPPADIEKIWGANFLRALRAAEAAAAR